MRPGYIPVLLALTAATNAFGQGAADKLVTPDMNMNSIAPYLQSKFILGKDWIFKAGARYENLLFKVSDFTKGTQLVPGATNTYHALVFNVPL